MAAHVVHPPPWHVRPVEHVFPQPPQLLLSVCSSTHRPAPVPHTTSGAGHTHAPAVQLAPLAQLIPQPPQLASSVCVSTHTPVPAPQTAPLPGHAQTPSAQTAPLAQVIPHPPQLVFSSNEFTQLPSHSNWPGGHLQVPAAQLVAVGHIFPHSPQFSGSVVSSTQAPPHTLPPGQVHTAVSPASWHSGVGGGHATGLRHAPAGSHAWTALPVHLLAPGMQAMQAPTRHIGVLPPHGSPTACQAP
jgi:hypothetical protein